jgi:hypothetical protein
MMRDADFGMVRLRAFGIYSMRVGDPKAFIKEIAGASVGRSRKGNLCQRQAELVPGTRFCNECGQKV